MCLGGNQTSPYSWPLLVFSLLIPRKLAQTVSQCSHPGVNTITLVSYWTARLALSKPRHHHLASSYTPPYNHSMAHSRSIFMSQVPKLSATVNRVNDVSDSPRLSRQLADWPPQSCNLRYVCLSECVHTPAYMGEFSVQATPVGFLLSF